jgi:hypothetical protein
LIHLNHRLVQMCLRLLRAEVWAQSDVKKLHRVDVRTVPSAMLDDPAVVIVSRLVVTGGRHHRLHEELTLAGGLLRDKAFVREARVTQLNEWYEKAASSSATPRLFEGLRRRFDRHADAVIQAVEARSRDRLRNLESTLEGRKQKEIDNILTVLDELAKTIEIELRKAKEPDQLTLFSEDERLQVRRDDEALKRRLQRIPQEKEEEAAAIRARYDGFQVRTFPVAVLFLVPAGHPWRTDT